MIGIISETVVKNAKGKVVGQVVERNFGFLAMRTMKNPDLLRGIGIYPTFADAEAAVVKRAAKCGDR